MNDFARDHPDIRTALEHWYRSMKRRNCVSLAEVRTVFPTTEKVGIEEALCSKVLKVCIEMARLN